MTSTSITNLVSEEQVHEFDEHGAVLLRGAFDLDWIEKLIVGLEKNIESPGPDRRGFTPEGAPGEFFSDFCNWQRIPEYRDFVLHSPAASLAGQLTKSREIRIFHEHILVKEPGTQETTPWHQDLPYYCIEGTQLCSIWLPLDTVPLNASLRLVSGSHRFGKRFIPRFFVDHSDYDSPIEGYEPVPDIDARADEYRILSWDLEPGDCVAFHMLTLHGAFGTETLKTRRRAFSTRWLGDDAVYATRPWATSPPFPELDLEPGKPPHNRLFPVAWRAGSAAV